MAKNKLIKRRIRHLKAVATLLQLTPFLRCILLNGSLAEGKTKRTSDVDLLIVAKDNRIFTTRFFASILVWLTGLKRSSDESKDHSGRFCLNYYLTESFLVVPTGRGEEVDRYCASNYSKSLMVWGMRDIYFQFMEINRENWKKYLNFSFAYEQKGVTNPRSRKYHTNIQHTKYRKILKKNFPIRTFHTGIRLRNIVEQLLGDRAEGILKRIQLRKINRDPRTKKYPTYIVVNDKEMRFHPPSQ